jgi:peptidoglycan/xylan/chitin deacetylase (PgdA/CDA1 family)
MPQHDSCSARGHMLKPGLVVACLLSILLLSSAASQATYVVFTIDVCWTCGTDFQGTCGGVEYGVPLIAKKLEQQGFKGTFFVSPYCPRRLEKEMFSNLRFLVSRGHDLQLHTHTETIDLSRPRLNMYSREEKRKILSVGIENIMKAGAPPPTAHRAGGFSMDDETLQLLPKLGIRIDSSAFPLWSECKLILPQSDINRFVRIGDVFELPVTLIKMVPLVGYMGMSPLSLDSATWEQQQSALNQAADHGLPVVTIFFHYHTLFTCTWSGVPYEPLQATGPNESNVAAFENILKMLASDDRFKVVTMRELWELCRKNPNALDGPSFIPYTGLYLTYMKSWRHFSGHHSIKNKIVALAPILLILVAGIACMYWFKSRRRSRGR